MRSKFRAALAALLLFATTAVCVIANASTIVIDGTVKDIDALIASYENVPGIERIDMYDTRLKPEQIEYIKSRLPGVDIGCQVWLVEKHYIRTDATAFAINHNNKSKKHRSADFEALKYCPDIMALDLSHNDIDDLSFLLHLPKLKVLLLGDNDIDDVSVLSSLDGLEYLELFKNRIRDIEPLSRLGHLIDLNLSHNAIADFTPLSRLTSLERLWIYNGNNYSAKDPVPKETVSMLEDSLSGTYIDAVSYSTLGGWRKHPRYYVVFNMLHGVLRWLPWDADGLIPRYE